MTAIHPRFSSSNQLKSTKISGADTIHNHAASSGRTLATTSRANGPRHDAAERSKLDPQTANQLRHWNGKVDTIAQARHNNHELRHEHHDHHWWRRHCAAIIFFDFGWWGWWDGWWYPCWGYDPYSYYGYDEPVYGYGGLAPDQVVVNVQSSLQQQGYFSYAADGRMGPLTQAAIANYQRDHRLPITGDIDPATLGALGLTD
jgi:hypothetical protein